MEDRVAIEVKHISKSFKIHQDKSHTMKDTVVSLFRRKYERREVLKDLSFTVKQGEAVGLVGHNGCGKSTTLKLLTKIMYPDSGSIKMNGRVSSLIELGAGFHPDMTGRENIYINASIFGLTKREIDARIDEIIDFSELEEYIDTPVRTYSSGMYMRLAFSVAINVDADILLIDEILAVGDVRFQSKCFKKLHEIKTRGVAIVIVSHSLEQIEQVCDRSIWIQNGLIHSEGIPRNIHSSYLEFMGKKKSEQFSLGGIQQKGNRWGNGDAVINKIIMCDSKREEKQIFKTGENVLIRFEYKLNKKIQDAVFGIGIFRNDGLQCYGTNTRIDRLDNFDIVTDGACEVELEGINLLPGEYMLDVTIEYDLGIPVDYFREAYQFEIYSDIRDVGVARMDHEWILDYM